MAVNTVPVELTVTQVDGDTDLVEVLVQAPVVEVFVEVPGAQGIPGPKGDTGAKGDPGASGDLSYYEEFLVPVAQWTVNHNLGKRPVVSVFSVGGLEMWAEVLQTSVNQVLISFDGPVAGYVICS